jgi:hypothetical protein
MATAGLTEPDWQQPWFAPVADIGRAALADDGDEAVHRRLDRLLTRSRPSALLTAGRVQRPLIGLGSRLRFVPRAALPAGVAYETHIWQTGCVPTRDSPHDFFNGLVWLTYPRIKVSLNRLQATALAAAQSGESSRAPARDAATLFDENGLVFACANDGLAAALRRFDWQRLFVAQRTATLMQTESLVVGHALFDKLRAPCKSVTAHVLIVPVDDSYFRAPLAERIEVVDRRVSAWLDNWPLFAPRDLAPVPVLGLPGWWPANADPAFYQDTQVFRPGHRHRPADTGNG